MTITQVGFRSKSYERELPNRIRFSESGPARTVYENLREDERREIEEILEYIRDVPFEHGAVIRRMYRPPVTFYVYYDERWRVSYSLSLRGAFYDIGVWSIERADIDMP